MIKPPRLRAAFVLRTFVIAVALMFGGAILTASPAVHAENREKALKLFAKAKKLSDSGDSRGALKFLKQALEEFDNDGIRLSMVGRHLDLGEPEEAATILSQVTDKKMRKPAKALRKRIEDLLAKPVTVKLTAEPSSAEVSIDGSDWQPLKPSLTLPLPRGKHRFTFRAKGRKNKDMVVVLKGIKKMPIHATLGAPPGSWRVQLEPSGDLKDVRISFNGKQVALSSEERLASLSLPRQSLPGRFKVQCFRGIDDFASATVDIQTGKESVATCEFPSADGSSGDGIHEYNLIAGGVGAGLFAVGIAAGIGLFVSYEQDKKDFPPPQFQLESSKPIGAGISIGLGVVSGILSALFFTEIIDLAPTGSTDD